MNRSKSLVILLVASILAAVFAIRLVTHNKLENQLPLTAKAPGTNPSGDTPAVSATPADKSKISGAPRGIPSTWNFATEAEKLKALPLGQERLLALETIIVQWMKKAPMECIAFLEGLGLDPTRVVLSKFAVQQWLESDPESAKQFVEASVRNDEQNSQF